MFIRPLTRLGSPAVSFPAFRVLYLPDPSRAVLLSSQKTSVAAEVALYSSRRGQVMYGFLGRWFKRDQKVRSRGRLGRIRLQLEELEERTAPALLGQQLFPANNPWNQQITNAPVAANSTAIINNITALYGNGRLHPDFGQDYRDGSDLYGIPFNVVHGNSVAKVNFVIDGYPGESDIQPTPLPVNPVIEGDFQNGPRVGVDNRGDSHLLVWDV